MPHGGARPLVLWSWILLALVAAHDVTHVLDDGLETPPAQLAYVAIPQWIFLAVAMAVVVRGDPARSRLAALLLGAAVALGFAVVHLVPLSPAALWELEPSPISWLLVWMCLVAALVLVALAWRPRRVRGIALTVAAVACLAPLTGARAEASSITASGTLQLFHAVTRATPH